MLLFTTSWTKAFIRWWWWAYVKIYNISSTSVMRCIFTFMPNVQQSFGYIITLVYMHDCAQPKMIFHWILRHSCHNCLQQDTVSNQTWTEWRLGKKAVVQIISQWHSCIQWAIHHCHQLRFLCSCPPDRFSLVFLPFLLSCWYLSRLLVSEKVHYNRRLCVFSNTCQVNF